ncbi:hypothetical protein XarCFBP6762_07905 [Xanthomonas arboricola]|nr:hypothetical protein XarCFBP6762_07905 [Xanthomonas arboricola]
MSRSAADTSASSSPLEHSTKSSLVKSRLSRVCRTSSIEQRASRTALTVHTDHLHWSLPAHRRGTLRGMDAA